MNSPNILYVVDEWRAKGGAHRYLCDLIGAFSDNPQRIVAGRVDSETPLPIGMQFQRCRALSSPVSNSRGLSRLDEWINWADVISIQNVHNPIALNHFSKTGKAIVTIQDHRFFCPSIGKTLPNRQQCLRVAQTSTCRECISDSSYLTATLDLMLKRRQAIADARCVVLSDYMAREWVALTGHRPLIAPPWVSLSIGTCEREGWMIAGRLTHHKNPNFAYEAWKRSGQIETLYVVGEGPSGFDGEGIESLGWVSHEEMLKRLKQVRGLLFPSLWQEPYGIVGLEALACHTPVIALASGGMNAWMGSGVRAVSSIEEMAEEMRNIVSGSSFRFGTASSLDYQRARSVGRWSALIATVASKN